MDLTDEASRASTRRANSAPGYLPVAAVADLAGTDAKVVFVARHQTRLEVEHYRARPEMQSA
jgi:hypothetical protein